MATKSFLTPEDQREASVVIRKPASPPSGDERRGAELGSLEFSAWLIERLLLRLKNHPDWKRAGPIALGSWSRGEIAPKSDIDLLFVGSEDAVLRLVGDLSSQGLKIRYRMPEQINDWSVGVEPFDVLALLGAVALEDGVRLRLEEQKEKLRARGTELRKKLLQAMLKEREDRARRFDSISNYLEPNLKYGPGGLRDLEQALMLRDLDPDRFRGGDAKHAFDVLLYYKRFFLLVRQRLHLSDGGGEILSAPEQRPIAEWLGYASSRDFMKEIQKGVSRVSFYADWAFEQATASRTRLEKVGRARLSSPVQLFEALEHDASLLMQNRVRQAADQAFATQAAKTSKAKRAIGRKLTQILDPSEKEAQLIAFFRARLIDHVVPEFRRIVGHVQHDQYHRFSVDAHILQVLRELKRLKKNARTAGVLQSVVKSLTKSEWEILAFACLYHDIAKGREGDHSKEGVLVACQDLKAMGKSESFINDVTWIVEQHLALSAAAFRENPHSPRTWNGLAEKGVKGRRLALLAVFTIVDIRGTNPDAWTPWKERLLGDVVQAMERPETSSIVAFMDQLTASKMDLGFGERLDGFLISSVPVKHLIDDLKKILRDKSADLGPRVIRLRAGATWIRFHSREDRPGLFAGYVGLLSGLGLSIRHASIHTFEETGVYDWFEVKTLKRALAIEKQLLMATASAASKSLPASLKPIEFDAIELVAQGQDEWVVSFKGRDQSGALVAAARALFDEQVSVRWARVHTWGRQIDDIFGVAPCEGGASELVQRLRARLGASGAVKTSAKL